MLNVRGICIGIFKWLGVNVSDCTSIFGDMYCPLCYPFKILRLRKSSQSSQLADSYSNKKFYFNFSSFFNNFEDFKFHQIYPQIAIFSKTFDIQITAKCARNVLKMPYTAQKMRIALHFPSHIDVV